MNTLLLIGFILAIIESQATLTNFPGGPFESYKAYVRGLCASIATDCDLSLLSTCFDDDSARKLLIVTYQAYQEVLKSPPNESSNVLKAFFIEKSDQNMASVQDALRCEENLPYAKQVYEKTSAGQGFAGAVANTIFMASVRPNDAVLIFRNSMALAEQGNFEAMGLIDGNYLSQAASLRMKELADWHQNAKHGRSLTLKGMCESLGLSCPMDSLNCMDEQASLMDLQAWYEWFNVVASKSIQDGPKAGVDFFLGRWKELYNQFPQSAVNCDRNSQEVKLMSEKLGMDVWSNEWLEVIMSFMNEFPELTWHYKVAENRMFENNDLEGAGMVLGLEWFQISQWRQGQFVRKGPAELEDL